VFSLVIAASGDRDELIADLWAAGTTGITEEEETLRAFFEDGAEGIVLQQLAPYAPALEREENRDWVRDVQEQWKPFPVGDRWWLVPEWRDDPAPEGRIALRIHPGMACGTGWHAATQLCLQALERYPPGGLTLLDVGTGSGILAEAARLLGAFPIGCDIEHEATVIARANLGDRVPLFTGSLRSVREDAVRAVVANLNAATLRSLAVDLKRVVVPGGLLILSGFRNEEADEVADSLRLSAYETLEHEGWACLISSSGFYT
jgi:ribosomal protein L11 methyltransferase